MPRYYFHLHDGVDILLDTEGAEIPLEDAIARAFMECRAMIAHEALGGRIDLRQRIDIEDETGSVLHSVSFGDAVEIIAHAKHSTLIS